MKKLLWLIGVLIVAGIWYQYSEKDYGTTLPTSFPKEIPVIQGQIAECKTYRSDELKRGIQVKLLANRTLDDTFRFYKEEFAKNSLARVEFSQNRPPAQPGEDTAIGEVGMNQVVVIMKSEGTNTRVDIQVLGNSIMLLPGE